MDYESVVPAIVSYGAGRNPSKGAGSLFGDLIFLSVLCFDRNTIVTRNTYQAQITLILTVDILHNHINLGLKYKKDSTRLLYPNRMIEGKSCESLK